MDQEERVIGSIESLEAQLEMAREFVRLKKWENLGSVVQSIARTASCLAEATLIAKFEHPAALSRHAGTSTN
jgi:hypothetical protein